MRLSFIPLIMGGMDNLLPAIAGGTIGAILTAFISLIVTHMNNDTQRTISENDAYWQAQRQADDAERRATHEHEVWVRERKEKLYSDYLVKAETIKQTQVASIVSIEAQNQIVEAFDVLMQPNLLVIASREVSRQVLLTQNATVRYFQILTGDNPNETEWSNLNETQEARDAFREYKKAVNQTSNAMRIDLGLEPLYKTPVEKVGS